MKIPLQEKCRSDASFLLNRFIIIVHYFEVVYLGRGFFSCPRRQSTKMVATSAGVAKKAPSQISYFCWAQRAARRARASWISSKWLMISEALSSMALPSVRTTKQPSRFMRERASSSSLRTLSGSA